MPLLLWLWRLVPLLLWLWRLVPLLLEAGLLNPLDVPPTPDTFAVSTAPGD
jgi:hypothetical protein